MSAIAETGRGCESTSGVPLSVARGELEAKRYADDAANWRKMVEAAGISVE